MLYAREQAIFANRYDAGRQLAAKLSGYRGQSAVVLAIPNGGVPVGLEVALAIDAEFDLIICRKIPLPLNPEAGFGAVADDGTVILNEELVKHFGLRPEQINYQVNQVKVEIRQRSLLYRGDRPLAVASGKTVIITDDGLASGFTMAAAVQSVRHRRPKEIIAAAPVASLAALERLEKIADSVLAVTTGVRPRFAVADFYHQWYDLSDGEVMQCLKEWRMRHFGPTPSPQP